MPYRYLLIEWLNKKFFVRMGIASNIVLDTLQDSDGTARQSFGGPPFYAGITCRKFGFDVLLATKVGLDAPDGVRELLRKEEITLENRNLSPEPTTRFSIIQDAESRRMVVNSRCARLSAGDIAEIKVDCWLVSPVFDEVPPETLKAIVLHRGSKDFVMLDPQGYMRYADSEGNISLRDQLNLDLAGIRAIKVDEREMMALTGLSGIDGMKELQSRGVELVLATIPNEIHLLHRNIHCWAGIKQIDTPDSTGAGDILAAAFACAFLREKDSLWALCFGAGTLQAALETGSVGIDKIPSYSKIEENASYLYNTVRFKRLS